MIKGINLKKVNSSLASPISMLTPVFRGLGHPHPVQYELRVGDCWSPKEKYT